MRILFSVLSIFYISGIFLLAGSPFISKIATFNPYSLLHIPLYGILTVFLVFSFVPFKFNYFKQGKSYIQRFNNLMTHLPNNLMPRCIIAGLIALGVAVADEVHQTSIPGRDGSIADVLLDFVGIALVLFFTFRLLKKNIVNPLTHLRIYDLNFLNVPNLTNQTNQRDQIDQTDLSREIPNFLLSHRDQTNQINEKDPIED